MPLASSPAIVSFDDKNDDDCEQNTSCEKVFLRELLNLEQVTTATITAKLLPQVERKKVDKFLMNGAVLYFEREKLRD